MPIPTSAPGTSSVDAPPGEYVCSDSACRRRWDHGGGPLPYEPVDDGSRTAPPRHRHPCPACLEANPAIAGFTHSLLQRTAADLHGWAEPTEQADRAGRPGSRAISRA